MRKRRIKARPLIPKTWATPTKERCRQNGGVICEIIPADPQNRSTIKRYRAAWASPLEAYRTHKVINESSYRAGLRFHQVYYGAVLCRKIDVRPVSQEEATTAPTTHDKLLKEAYAMLPADTRSTVIDVCGHSDRVYSPKALEKLRKGLGQLAVKWHSAAIEVCDYKPPSV